jgi:hypothetical protein
VNKDGSGYPPNSLIVGMFDGYYTLSSVPGVMVPPRVMHSMMDLLPPMSLLEVNKSEVCMSVCSTMILTFISFLGARFIPSSNFETVGDARYTFL